MPIRAFEELALIDTRAPIELTAGHNVYYSTGGLCLDRYSILHLGTSQIRNFAAKSYLFGMRKTAFEPCIPTRGTKVPSTKDWLHEIKHDGYRMIVQREDKRVRLFTKNGHDWTDRYPWIVESALKLRTSQFVIDGEAVLLGVDGISDFNGLHSRKHDDEVQLYAFDVLSLEGEDLRKIPLHLRKNNLDRLLARRPQGIFVSPFEQGEIGETAREPLPRRYIAELGQGEEPLASGNAARKGELRLQPDAAARSGGLLLQTARPLPMR